MMKLKRSENFLSFIQFGRMYRVRWVNYKDTKNTLIRNLGVYKTFLIYWHLNLLVVADGTVLRCFRQYFLNLAVFRLSTKFPNYPLGGECCEITELLVLRIYLEDSRYCERKPIYNIWAGTAALLLQFLFSSCSRTKTTTNLMLVCKVKLNRPFYTK